MTKNLSVLKNLLAVTAALWGCAHAAGPLHLTVTDSEGKPAPDVVVLVMPAAAKVATAASAPVVIAQENLRFVPFLTVVPSGSTLKFVNRDGYDHHVRSTPSGPLGKTPAVSSFELRLGAAKGATTQSAEIKVDQPGAIGLGCHLHSSMRGNVYVSDTPWFGKTDAAGVVTIEGIPDGNAQISLWHPDQVQEQAGLKAQVSSTPAKVNAQLNFVPRRRRG
jgi:plastocyanin